ncbi:MAG: DNA repair protein RecO [Prolixibacteraceae bacterium]|nr:DNA repair protein RecO [Prolixibacteraceae bacterium]
MIEKTKGIFLRSFKYSDSSVIAHIYTEKFGRQSFIIRGIHSKKSNTKINLFQPLSILDLIVYEKENRNIQHLKSAGLSVSYGQIPYDIKRNSQVLFITEILMKCLKEEESNPPLFKFLVQSAITLDEKEEGISNFSVVFLFQLTRFLGIFPNNPLKNNSLYFDMESSSFCNVRPFHHYYMEGEITYGFCELFQFEFRDMEKLSFSNSIRDMLLSKLLIYYKLHLGLTGEIKSLGVLKEIMR